VTAVPSEEDGRSTILRPRVYRIAIAYRLGVPVLQNEIPCLCKQPINKYGDHATCCAKSGLSITRHNSLRNFVGSIASDGLLGPILEKKGILGPTSGRRPGDVTIPNWNLGNGLAIDLAVTSPLLKSSMRATNPCEDYATNKKHRKYDASFEGTEYYFCAMVFETLGAINNEGEEVLRQLFRYAAKRLGREFSSYCGRAWARVSRCLQRSVAQAILVRIDGQSQHNADAADPSQHQRLPHSAPDHLARSLCPLPQFQPPPPLLQQLPPLLLLLLLQLLALLLRLPLRLLRRRLLLLLQLLLPQLPLQHHSHYYYFYFSC